MGMANRANFPTGDWQPVLVVAEQLGVTRRTVERWVRRYGIATREHRLDRRLRLVHTQEIEQIVEARRVLREQVRQARLQQELRRQAQREPQAVTTPRVALLPGESLNAWARRENADWHARIAWLDSVFEEDQG